MTEKSKETTCKYNVHRHASPIIRPYCVWAKHNLPIMPPHIIFSNNVEDCKKCACYEKVPKRFTLDCKNSIRLGDDVKGSK